MWNFISIWNPYSTEYMFQKVWIHDAFQLYFNKNTYSTLKNGLKHFFSNAGYIIYDTKWDTGLPQEQLKIFINHLRQVQTCFKFMFMNILKILTFPWHWSSWYARMYHSTKNEVFHSGFLQYVTKSAGFPRIWSHLMKKPFMENLIFCAVYGI